MSTSLDDLAVVEHGPLPSDVDVQAVALDDSGRLVVAGPCSPTDVAVLVAGAGQEIGATPHVELPRSVFRDDV